MTQPPQPWYEPRQPQQLAPENPYAAVGRPPPEPPRRRRFGGGPVLAVVVVLLLLAAGGGVYAFTKRDGGGRSAAPDAKGPPRPSATASAKPTRAPQRIPTTEELNAGRKPGEARAWIVDDRTDLPRRNIPLKDLWVVGDTVVQAVFKKVVAHRVSDGAELWSVPLPAPVCETPADPTPDGKVVLVYQNNQGQQGGRCNQLQMIDLRTGKAGWHKELTETGSKDDTIIVDSAISGGTFAVVQSMRAFTYRVADGTRLYEIPMENPGKCYPDQVAGGTRLLVVSTCAILALENSHSQLREIDPLTGAVKWRFRTESGRKVGAVLSVDPVVITTMHNEKRTEDWRVVAIGPDGKARTTIDARAKGFKHCGDHAPSGKDVQRCIGTAVGHGVVLLGGTKQVGAYDLATGKLVWGVQRETGDYALYPLRAEAGKAGLVYERGPFGTPGTVLRFGPGGVENKKEILKHPASGAKQEYRMQAGRLAYVNDRLVITPSGVTGNDAEREARMLSFGP